MGKLASLLAAGTGMTAVSVGGFYLLNRNDVAGAETPSQPESISTKNLEFDTLEAFKQGWKTKSKCISGSFFANGISDDDKLSTATELKAVEGVPIAETFFKADQNSSDPYRSCLIVDWKREDYAQNGNNKWKGKFTWTWFFVRGSEGFVNFNIAETSSEASGQLVLKGVFYLLEKREDTNNQWTIKHYKEIKDSPKKVGISVLDQHLPNVGTGVTVNKTDYWGFFKGVENGNRLKNICGDTDCQPTTKSPTVDGIKLSWTGSNTSAEESKKLKDWSKDLIWWDKLYSKDNFNLEEKIKDFSGSWTLAS